MWRWCRVVSDRLVQITQFKCFVSALRQLANDSCRLASNDAEAWDDHIGGHDCVVEDSDVIFDDGKLADHNV